MTRQPAVAGRFYPGNSKALQQEITNFIQPYSSVQKKKGMAVVSPHAGYIYSGAVTAETLSHIEIPETVVILGLNHHGRGAPVALSRDTWHMVVADTKVDETFCDALLQNSKTIVVDEAAHQYEHSVEVQIPFLLELQPKLQIVPIVLSHLSYADCKQFASELATTIQGFPHEVLIVASSDMSHYESRTVATRKDRLALEMIEQLNPEGLYTTVHSNRISMCGVIPVTIALLTVSELGATRAELIRYTDSGDVSGDTGQVVGYAGMVLS
ncbi:AmmeMemoRadiSam system protein B [Desulfopila sp. IMCC35008]|uniref:AmmeMemoRadiSam system protein B n=1 Tax=Desulfopila sp. IMCC35008 TaxID=2653858 RepID=UPI0013D76210|nr:AmmeMemoRadiSam system protein B [Desulfopila sp. IMCC35008]